MHYVPRLLLRRFEDEGGLWELDIVTGICERRNVDNAGKERHLYTVALETGFLKSVDAEAGKILRDRVYDRDEITISDSERRVLAAWLASLVHRNPKKLVGAKEFIGQALDDTASVLERDIDYGHEYVETFRREHPAEWRRAVVELATDEELADALKTNSAEELLQQAVIFDVNEQIRTRTFQGETSAKVIFCRTINSTRSIEWAAWMLEFSWEWVRTEREFIIGDDPLSRWSNRLNHIEYGFKHADCEVTIPLSRRLCLRMHREGPETNIVKTCDYEETSKYNNRQILAATKKVFGSSRQMQNKKQRWDDIAAGRCRLPRGG